MRDEPCRADLAGGRMSMLGVQLSVELGYNHNEPFLQFL